MSSTRTPPQLESFSIHIKALIFLNLSDANSVVSLALTGPDFYLALMKHQGAIARKIASKILEEHHPDIIKLAFMAIESRLINNRSVPEVKRFLGTYVHHEAWPSPLYRIRAVQAMSTFHAAVLKMGAWMVRYAIVWPVGLEYANQKLSITEKGRQKQHAKRADEALLKGHSAFTELAHRFWTSFSKEEAYSFFCLLFQIDRFEYLPWHKDPTKTAELVPLYDQLNFIRIYQQSGKRHGKDSEVRLSIMRSFRDPPFFGLEPAPPERHSSYPAFVNDAGRFHAPETYNWVYYQSDGCFEQANHLQANQWLLVIGDKRRWKKVIEYAVRWSDASYSTCREVLD
ncbi:hypothetical protein BJ170DRAFT_713643 [Xylariales sp. AK1849]|nr:hypothetical protein BJ170DRAFT_713643 [Xylariales sp. AK1849]